MPKKITIQDFFQEGFHISFASLEAMMVFLSVCEYLGVRWVSGALPTQPTIATKERLFSSRYKRICYCDGLMFSNEPEEDHPEQITLPYDAVDLEETKIIVINDMQIRYLTGFKDGARTFNEIAFNW